MPSPTTAEGTDDVLEDVFIRLPADERRRNARTLRKGARELDMLVDAMTPSASVAARRGVDEPAHSSGAPVQSEIARPPMSFELEPVEPPARRQAPPVGLRPRPPLVPPPTPARSRGAVGMVAVGLLLLAGLAVALWLLLRASPSG